MEEIKVNEYVKTKGGKIDKVKYNNYYMKQYIDCERGLYLRDNITKHSFNLIDLIEVKDIVVMLDTKFNTKDYIFIDDKEMLKEVKEDLKDRCKLLEVLTHEQFKANCYKIEQK